MLRFIYNLSNSSFVFALLIFPIFLASCSHPPSYEHFVDVASYKEQGRFKYMLDMSDSLSTYDISFYTGIDCTEEDFEQMDDIQLDISLISPSGRVYRETVYLLKETYSESNSFSKTYKVLYRSGLIPKEFGEWVMTVTLPQLDAHYGFYHNPEHIHNGICKGLRGLGIILNKEPI